MRNYLEKLPKTPFSPFCGLFPYSSLPPPASKKHKQQLYPAPFILNSPFLKIYTPSALVSLPTVIRHRRVPANLSTIPQDDASSLRIAEQCLFTISGYVDWVTMSPLFQDDNILMQMLLTLMGMPKLRLQVGIRRE